MNQKQKKVCIFFALFLLLAGLILLGNNKSLSAIVSIALSGGGFYFFFSGKTEERKRTRFRETKVFKILLGVFLCIVATTIAITVIFTGIDSIIEKIDKENAQYVSIIGITTILSLIHI